MERFKICPKCQGYVFIEWDCGDGGWYENCLQCGHRHYLPQLVKTVSETKGARHYSKRKKKKKRGVKNAGQSKQKVLQ